MKLAEGVVRLLLWLYPPQARRRDGQEIRLLFSELAQRELARSGRAGLLWLSARTALDLVWQATLAWSALVLSPARAFVSRRRALGGPTKRRLTVGQTLINDLATAGRSFRHRPALTLTAVVTLGLGIGAGVAMFGVVYGVLLRPLGLEQPEQLVNVRQQHVSDARDASGLSPDGLLALRDGLSSAPKVAGAVLDSVTLTRGGAYHGEARELPNAVLSTSNLFDVLGVRALEGRLFVDDDAPPRTGRGTVAVISDALFASMFGSDRSAIGSTLVLDGVPSTLVGVVSSTAPAPVEGSDVWIATGMDPTDRSLRRRILTVARMAPETSLQQLNVELGVLYEALAERQPDLRGWTASASLFREDLLGSVRRGLLIAFAGVGLLLLLACANFANLMMARLARRQTELSTRACLGATRRTLFRQLAVESQLIALLAGAFGVLSAAASHQYLVSLGGSMLPRAAQVQLDWPVLLFALAVSVLCGLFFGQAPAAFGVGGNLRPQSASMRGGRGLGSKLSGALAAAQVSLAVVLVAAALLLFASFRTLASSDPGIAVESTAMVRIYLDDDRYDDLAKQRTYFEALTDRYRQIPGVVAVGSTTSLPMEPDTLDFDLPYSRPDQPQPEPEQMPQAFYRTSSPGYFEAIGTQLERGRTFRPEDVDGAPVVIINQTLARIAWPESDALGRLLRMSFRGTVDYEVVGIVADSGFSTLGAPAKPEMHFPTERVPFGGRAVVVRTSGDPAQLLPALRTAALEVDPSQPVNAAATLSRLTAGTLAAERFYSRLATFVGALALALALSGVYALIAAWASSNRFEIALRRAVGASRLRIVSLLVGKSLRLVVAGGVIGIASSLLLLGNLRTLLNGVAPLDPRALGLSVLVLAVVGLIAGLLPARSALRGSVASTLRK